MPKETGNLQRNAKMWEIIEEAVKDYGTSVYDMIQRYKGPEISPEKIVIAEIDEVKESIAQKYGKEEDREKIARLFKIADHPIYATEGDETGFRTMISTDADFF